MPLFILFVFGCPALNKKDMETNHNSKLTSPETISVQGDFDGDGKQNILSQFLADSTGRKVEKLPLFEKETWEEIVDYYSRHGYYTALVMNREVADTLTFSHSQGLYCLINLGDLNNDERDEIALVVDRLDFSRANYCSIYSLCSTGWKELFQFNVHEDAFDHTGDMAPIYKNIPEVLEHRNGEWRFYDYLDMDYETEEEVGQMKELKVGPCN